MSSSTAEGRIENAEPRIQALRQRIHQLVSTVQNLQRSCDELGHQDAVFRKQQQGLHDQLAALMQERDQLKSERDALAASQQELNSERASDRAERDDLEEQRDALQAEHEGFEVERDDLKSGVLTQTNDPQEPARQLLDRSDEAEVLDANYNTPQQERVRAATENLTLWRAVERLFDSNAYAELRPDVAKMYNKNNKMLLNHFLHRGIWETNFPCQTEPEGDPTCSHLANPMQSSKAPSAPSGALGALEWPTVTPIQQYLHPSTGGIAWPGDDKWNKFRFILNGSYDDSPSNPETFNTTSNHEPTRLSGDWVWGGFAMPHFGHMIADFLPRLINYYAICKAESSLEPCRNILFAAAPNERSAGTDAPTLIRNLVRYLVGGNCRIRLVTSPLIVEKIHVAVQGEYRDFHSPTQAPTHYIQYLIENQRRNELIEYFPNERLYVSRAGLGNKLSKFAGAAYLEAAFEQNGYKVIRPECRSLDSQLLAIARSGNIVFDEGSAMHSIQLFGHLKSNISVLLRTQKSRLATNCIATRLENPINYYNSCAGTFRSETASEAQQISFLQRMEIESGLGVRIASENYFFDAVMHDVQSYCNAWIQDAAEPTLKFICNLDQNSPDFNAYSRILGILSDRFRIEIVQNKW